MPDPDERDGDDGDDQGDQGARFLEALGDLVDLAAEIPATEALAGYDKTVTEAFFRDWPTVRSWGDSLYARLQYEIGGSDLPDDDPKSPETGDGD
jgi:hypothetical protein